MSPYVQFYGRFITIQDQDHLQPHVKQTAKRVSCPSFFKLPAKYPDRYPEAVRGVTPRNVHCVRPGIFFLYKFLLPVDRNNIDMPGAFLKIGFQNSVFTKIFSASTAVCREPQGFAQTSLSLII